MLSGGGWRGGSSGRLDGFVLVIEIRHRMKFRRANSRLTEVPTSDDRYRSSRARRAVSLLIQVQWRGMETSTTRAAARVRELARTPNPQATHSASKWKSGALL